jgi:hypothetical protein
MIGRRGRNVFVCSLTLEWQIDFDLTCDRGDVDDPEGCTLGCPLLLQTTNIDALKRDAQIEAKDITVETSGAMVTLRGRVHSWREHDDAEHAAFSAPGVGSVSNLLTVSY